jgi:hypothetical protein
MRCFSLVGRAGEAVAHAFVLGEREVGAFVEDAAADVDGLRVVNPMRLHLEGFDRAPCFD